MVKQTTDDSVGAVSSGARGHGRAHDQRLRSEFCTPAFPCPVQDGCGLHDGRRRTRQGDVLGKKPLPVPLVESNHIVEQLAAAAPHPTLGDTCQGLSNEVRTASIFMDRMAAGTSVPYFASRSWIRNPGAAPNGNASRNCWMIQLLVGCFVMLKCRIRRRSWPMTKKQ